MFRRIGKRLVVELEEDLDFMVFTSDGLVVYPTGPACRQQIGGIVASLRFPNPNQPGPTTPTPDESFPEAPKPPEPKTPNPNGSTPM